MVCRVAKRILILRDNTTGFDNNSGEIIWSKMIFWNKNLDYDFLKKKITYLNKLKINSDEIPAG